MSEQGRSEDRDGHGGPDERAVDAELVGAECSYWAGMPRSAAPRSGPALAVGDAIAASDAGLTVRVADVELTSAAGPALSREGRSECG